MSALPSLLTTAHLVGLALGLGAATVKLALLVGSRSDAALLAAFLRVARPVTRVLITGIVLLLVSGIGWLLLGYDLTPLLIAKLVLVATILALGPVIDNVLEPRFRAAAPAAGAPPSGEFLRARARYLAVEVLATALFYAVVVLWIWG
jgi:hypothetical protein